jgi:hypothetical protein
MLSLVLSVLSSVIWLPTGTVFPMCTVTLPSSSIDKSYQEASVFVAMAPNALQTSVRVSAAIDVLCKKMIRAVTLLLDARMLSMYTCNA